MLRKFQSRMPPRGRSAGASSAKAAELLASVGSLSFTDSTHVAELTALLRKATKRDAITRIKAISDLKVNLRDFTTNDEVLGEIISDFVSIYSRQALFDCEWRVREGFHTLLGIVGAKLGRGISPYLQQLMPVWVAGLFDPAREASNAAQRALDGIFPDPDKKKKAVYSHCLQAISDFTISTLSRTPRELADICFGEGGGGEHDDETERARVVKSALWGVVAFLIQSDCETFVNLRPWEVYNSSNCDGVVRARALSVLTAAIRKSHGIFLSFEKLSKKIKSDTLSLISDSEWVVSQAGLEFVIEIINRRPELVDPQNMTINILKLVERGSLSDRLADLVDGLKMGKFHVPDNFFEKIESHLLGLMSRGEFSADAQISPIVFYLKISSSNGSSVLPSAPLCLFLSGGYVRHDFISAVSNFWKSADHEKSSFQIQQVVTETENIIADKVVQLLSALGLPLWDSVIAKFLEKHEEDAIIKAIERKVEISNAGIDQIANSGSIKLELAILSYLSEEKRIEMVMEKEFSDIIKSLDELPAKITESVPDCFLDCLSSQRISDDLSILKSNQIRFFSDNRLLQILVDCWDLSIAASVLKMIPVERFSSFEQISKDFWIKSILQDNCFAEKSLRGVISEHGNFFSLYLSKNCKLSKAWLQAASETDLEIPSLPDESVEMSECLKAFLVDNPSKNSVKIIEEISRTRPPLMIRLLSRWINGGKWWVDFGEVLAISGKSIEILNNSMVDYLFNGNFKALIIFSEIFQQYEKISTILVELAKQKAHAKEYISLLGVSRLALTVFDPLGISDPIVRQGWRSLCDDLLTDCNVPVELYLSLSRMLTLAGGHISHSEMRVNQISQITLKTFNSSDLIDFLTVDIAGINIWDLEISSPSVLTWLSERDIAIDNRLTRLEEKVISLSGRLLDRHTFEAVGRMVSSSGNFWFLQSMLSTDWVDEARIALSKGISIKAEDDEILGLLESLDASIDGFLIWRSVLISAEGSWVKEKIPCDLIDRVIDSAIETILTYGIPTWMFEKNGTVSIENLGLVNSGELSNKMTEGSVALQLFAYIMLKAPSGVCAWQSSTERRYRAEADRLCRNFLSLALLQSQIMKAPDNTSLQFSRSARQLVCNFRQSELEACLSLQFPDTWPLRAATVEASPIPGISKTKNKHQALAVQLALQTSTVGNAVRAWAGSVAAVLEGVEECYICYSVVHVESNSLPGKQCGTCKNKYHADCIFRWFRTSHKTNCPICQSPF